MLVGEKRPYVLSQSYSMNLGAKVNVSHMISEKEVRDKLDETINRLAKIKSRIVNAPPNIQRMLPMVEIGYTSRIKTLQEVLGTGSWDDEELSGNYKLDPRYWQ